MVFTPKVALLEPAWTVTVEGVVVRADPLLLVRSTGESAAAGTSSVTRFVPKSTRPTFGKHL